MPGIEIICTSGQLASWNSGRGFLPVVGGTAVGGTAVGGTRGRRGLGPAQHDDHDRHDQHDDEGHRPGCDEREDAVAFPPVGLWPCSPASRVFGCDANVVGGRRIDLVRRRRHRAACRRVAHVTAHQRHHEVPHRLVALLGGARLTHIGPDAQRHQVARRLHAGGVERVEVGALLAGHDQRVRVRRSAAAVPAAARRTVRAPVRSRRSAARRSPSCRRRRSIRSAAPRRKRPTARLPTTSLDRSAVVPRAALLQGTGCPTADPVTRIRVPT